MTTTAPPPPKRNLRAEALGRRCADKAWRMTNLYVVLNKSKIIERFIPNVDQARFYQYRHTRNFYPKARKRGVSTGIVLDYFDDCIWAKPERPVHAAHVDYRDDDAKEKLEICRLAWANGPLDKDPKISEIWKMIHRENPLLADNAGELKWANGSKQQASTSFMGGTPSRLHISEFGPLAAQFPDRADRLYRGTINAAPQEAIIDVETTMEGGTFGKCYEIFELAQKMEGKDLTPLDWKLFFISWLNDPECDLPNAAPEKEATRTYFRDLHISDGLVVKESKQAWYEKKKDEQKANMYTQFPTVLRECLWAGAGTCFFEPHGLIWQQARCVELENDIEWGDITVQGDVKDVDKRSANWRKTSQEVGVFQMLEQPRAECKYVLFADFCVGKMAEGSDDAKRDSHSYGIIREEYVDPEDNVRHLKKVVCLCGNNDQAPNHEIIRRIVALSIYYGDCLVIPETNGKNKFEEQLMRSGVRNMYKQGMQGADGSLPGTRKTEQVFGWLTTGTADGGGTRGQILDHMQEQTIQENWICGFGVILNQMSTFVRFKRGSPKAAPGTHDDHVMGPAIGLFNTGHATKFVSREQKIQLDYYQGKQELEWDPAGL